MAEDLLEALRREAEKLQNELTANATYLRLEAVRKTILVYEASEHTARATSRPPIRQRSQASSLIESTAMAILQVADRRMKSGEILEKLQEAGIPVGGQRPMQTLASLLSTSKRFNNIKGQGYGLVEWPDYTNFERLLEDTPENENAPEGKPSGGIFD